MENTRSAVIPDPEQKPLLRPTEVASTLRWSKNTVYELIHSGELAHIKVGGRYWVPTAALREYLRLPAAS